MRQEMNRRLDALEQRTGANERRWHQVLVEPGQSEDHAVAAYEALHGSVAGDNLILNRVVEPARWAA